MKRWNTTGTVSKEPSRREDMWKDGDIPRHDSISVVYGGEWSAF
jgi:hypothetical protein